MSLWILILIVLIGLVLLTLELVALPGGVAGVFGGIFIVLGIWQTYSAHGRVAGNIMLIASVVLCVALLAFLLKSRTWRFFSLGEQVDSKVNTIDEQKVVVGARGVTISRLAPMGKALIDGETVEVSTAAEFVDPEKPIEVLSVEGNKVLVHELISQENN